MTKHRPRQFTPKASKLWTVIPVEFQEKILAKVFCSQCGIGVAITNYKGAVKYGNIILRGSCAICGHEVVRLLDGPRT
jgi:ribosomal protein S27AE